MPWKCCVWKCKSTVKSPGIKLFRFPTVGKCLQQLARERIEEWKSALGYDNNFTPSNKRICNIHFRNGKPARLTDTHDPDWVPSQHLSKPRPQPSSILPMKQRNADLISTPDACNSTSNSREPGSFSRERSDTKHLSVHRDSRKSSGESMSPELQSHNSSKLFSRRKSRTPSTASMVSIQSSREFRSSTDSNPASGSRESKSFSPDRPDTKLSSVRRDSRESSRESMSLKAQSHNSSMLSSERKSLTPSTASIASIQSSRESRCSTTEACSSVSGSDESKSVSPDRSDDKTSSVSRDFRESSGEKSQSCDSSSLSSSQKSRTASTAPMAPIEYSRVSQGNVESHISSSGFTFSRPNVTPIFPCDYKDNKPKLKNASTMTDACNDPASTYKIIENYQRELQRLQGKVNSVQNQADFFKRGFEFISVSNEKCLYYTGISNFSTVKKITII